MNREVLWSDSEYNEDIDFGMNSLVEILRSYFKGDTLKIVADKASYRGVRGYKFVDMTVNNGYVFKQVYPSHDCIFTLYKEGGEIYAIVSSHDIPTGATWRFEVSEDEI